MDLRSAQNLTQKVLAEKSGSSPTTISNLENGKINKPQHRTMRRIAAALDISVVDLLESEAPTVKADALPSPEHKKVPEEELRRKVRTWEGMLASLAKLYKKAEEELQMAEPDVLPDSVIDVANAIGHSLFLLSREADEVRDSPGVNAATEKIRDVRASMERILEQKLGPWDNTQAREIAMFKAARDAESSLASIEEDRDERRVVS